MDEQELKRRSKEFGLAVIRIVESLPKSKTSDVIGRQLLRSATSVGANYRAACRARSDVEFLAKIGIVEEEADECGFWLEMLRDAEIAPAGHLFPMIREADELTAIFTATAVSMKTRLRK